MIHKDTYSSSYDPNNPEAETGVCHNWVEYTDGPYYGPSHKCSACGIKNHGGNLWREDFEETCQVLKEKVAVG